MKKFLIFLKVILILLIILDLLFWLLAHGSGHLIPVQTDIGIGITAGVLIILLIAISVYKKKIEK